MRKISLLFTIVIFCSCNKFEASSDKIWETNKMQFETLLASGQYEFVESFDFLELEKSNKLDEIYKINENAAYYFSFVLEELSLNKIQLKFLIMELYKGCLKKEALLKIAEILSLENRWDELIEYLNYYLNNVEHDLEIFDLLVKGYYNTKDYNNALHYSETGRFSYYSILSLIELNNKKLNIKLSDFVYNRASFEQISEILHLLHKKNLFFPIDLSLRIYLSAFSEYSKGNLSEYKNLFKDLSIESTILSNNPSLIYKMRIQRAQKHLINLNCEQHI